MLYEVITEQRFLEKLLDSPHRKGLEKEFGTLMFERGERSARTLALYRDPPAASLGRPIIPDCAMHCAAIVPEGNVVLGPAETNLKVDTFAVIVKHLEQCFAP